MALLELLASGPGTGKTSACIELFKNEILKSQSGIDSRSFFILPSQEHADRIRSLVLKKGTPGLFNTHILTINEFTARCLGSAATGHPTDAQRNVILKEILEDPDFSFPTFIAVADFKGFRKLFLDTIKEFKSNLLSIREFEKLAQPLLKNAAFRSRFRDFSTVLKNYETRLAEKNLNEPEDDIRKFVDRGEGFWAGLVVFDGFYHFTRAQRALIESVTRRASRVVVTLTLPSDKARRELFGYSERTRKFLTGIGFKEKQSGFAKNRRATHPALVHLEKNLFLESAAAYPGVPEAIGVFEAPHLRGEVEMIARRIKALYRESALHYSDICVILRSVAGYEKTVDLVFRQLEIPFYVHERRKMAENGLGVTLYRFLNLSQENWKRRDLFYLLKSSYWAPPGIWKDVLDWESLAVAQNVSEGRELWIKLARHAAPSVQDALRFLSEKHDELLCSGSIESFSSAILSFTGFLSARFGRAAGDADGQAVKTVESILKGAKAYYRFAPARRFSGRAFVREFQESLEAALFSVKPSGKNRVQVYDVVMALPKEYKVVFVAGLLEKTFPQEVIQDPFFKDAERRFLNRNGVVLEERSWRPAGERTFFYMAVTRARQKLFLSYPRYDGEGRPALPSFFVEDVRNIFPGIRPLSRGLDQFLPEPSEWVTEREVVAGLSESVPRGTSVGAEGRRWLDRPDFKEAEDFGRRILLAQVTDPRILKIFSETGTFSPTKLETYAACAFRYFASRVLFLNEPLEGREHLEIGNLLHRTFERFYRNLSETERADPLLWKKAAWLRRKLGETFEAVLKEENPFDREPAYRQAVYRRKAERLLDLFVGREKKLFEKRGLVPSHFELSFDHLILGDIRLEGKIDRIDLSPDGRQGLVIDYKKSRRSVSIHSRFKKGLEFQIPVYLLFLRRELGLEALGGELRFLQDSAEDGLYREASRSILGLHHKKAAYSDPDFEALFQTTEDRIRETVARLRSGDIRVKSKSCEHCELDAVCRFEKWKLVYG
jgi:ATP-dependent helicase/nuclease subunit B